MKRKHYLLDLFNGVDDRFVMAAIKSRESSKPVVRKNRFILLAAVIALTALLVGCGIVYVLKMQDLKLGDQQGTQEYWDEENKTTVYDTVSQQVLTFSGLKGTSNYEAAKEWYEFQQTYDPDHKLYHEQKEAGTLDWGPAEYTLYHCYTQEMRDKVDEISAKYGLKLRGRKVQAPNAESLYNYLNMDGVLLPGAKAEADDFNIAFHDGGWFYTDMHMNLTDNPEWTYQFLCSLYYNPKECFDTTICELNDTDDWQEWNYTTKSGDTVLVIRSPSVWYSWVFYDRPDATVTLRIETVREIYSDDGVTRLSMTDNQLKAVLDCFDFNIKPQPGDPTLLEVPTADQVLSQTNNGYTVTVKNVFTDGYTLKILLGITAPENVDLEQYMDENGRGGANFDNLQVAPAEEIDILGGGWNHGTRADNDGKTNTMDYLIDVSQRAREGMTYQQGSNWTLYLGNLMVKKWNKESLKWEILWEMEGSWNFEISLDNGDWREVEFISEPITTTVFTGWDANGDNVLGDITITSLKLRALGGDYDGEWGIEQPSLRYRDSFPTLTLKDGSTIQLSFGLEPYHEGNPSSINIIPLDEIVSLELIDGTKLYPQPGA